LPRRNKIATEPGFQIRNTYKFLVGKIQLKGPFGKSRRIYSFIRFFFYYLFIYAFESCAVLGYYAARSGNSLPVFRYNLSGPIGYAETPAKNYHYALRNNTEQRRSHLLCGRSLKSRIAWLVRPHSESKKAGKANSAFHIKSYSRICLETDRTHEKSHPG
jgi:hypothetical protein